MSKRNICIFFSDTGGGHRSAAEAVQAGVQEAAAKRGLEGQFRVIQDNIVEQSHKLNRFFVDLYNYLLRHHQDKMKYYYWFVQTFKPNDSELGYRIVARYLRKVVDVYEPSVIVSVHPMTNHYVARALADFGLQNQIKLITVLTDPNSDLWKGWGSPASDLIIAPNDLAADCLKGWGIPDDKIAVMGMPVHPQFLHGPRLPRNEFLSVMGLDPERTTITINSGWAGGGNMLDVFKSLGSVKKPIQSIFVCGHNNELFELANRQAAESPLPTVVLPFHDSMPDLMSASDLMVTKAGGLTTFEAIARRLPMALDLITEAMPQESGTADMLIEAGLAYPVRRAGDIVSVVESFSKVGDRFEKPLPEKHSLDQVGAVFDIASTIIAACEPDWDGKPRRFSMSTSDYQSG